MVLVILCLVFVCCLFFFVVVYLGAGGWVGFLLLFCIGFFWCFCFGFCLVLVLVCVLVFCLFVLKGEGEKLYLMVQKWFLFEYSALGKASEFYTAECLRYCEVPHPIMI